MRYGIIPVIIWVKMFLGKYLKLGVLSAVVAVVATVCAEESVTNAAGLLSLSSAEVAQGRTFSLSGVLIAELSRQFVLEDDSGRVPVDLRDASSFRCGDVIRIGSGKTVLTEAGMRMFTSDDAVRVGRGEAPKPMDVSLERLSSGEFNFAHVRVRGRVREVFADEVDAKFTYLTLVAGEGANSASVLCSVRSGSVSLQEGSIISISGVYTSWPSSPRRYGGPILESHERNGVVTIERAADDPSVFPEMPQPVPRSPAEIRALGNRRLSGIVLAVWDKRQLLLKDPVQDIHRVELVHGQPMPCVGDRILVGGTAETDLYHLNLSHAVLKTLGQSPADDATAERIVPERILNNEKGDRQVDPRYHGRLICLRGIVTIPQTLASDRGHLYLNCGRHVVPVDISAAERAEKPLGSLVEVTGICLMNVDNWRDDSPFPKIKGFSVITRSGEDVRLLARPPWWTPTRFLILIGILVAGLVVISLWSRSMKLLADRRGRELLREQVAHVNAALKTEERTRLAVELHDSLSQNLSGVACQVEAMRCALSSDPGSLASRILTVKRMLLSCRTELRRCLFDLRSDALEQQDMNEAIRLTLGPIIGSAELAVRFNVPRRRLLDTTAHTILCIVRELAANAVRHGGATRIAVAGGLQGDELLFSVRDNGSGFDPATAPGVQDGHFGLQGIRDRVERLGGSLQISVRNGGGIDARVSIRLHSSLGVQS